MNRFSLVALSLGLGLGFSIQAAVAADPPKAAAPAASAPAKKRIPKPPAAPKPAPDVPPSQASAEQMEAAGRVLYGNYDCEFKQTVTVERNPRYEGYADVVNGKQRYTMRPVVSPIGAIRLEDVKGKTLMVQIAYKSMLLDVQIGQRLVDECVHEAQAAAKKDADRVAAEAAAASAAPASPAGTASAAR